MARDGFFTGLDIGTSSIKVLVAEHVNNELNVIGVSNAKSAGVKDGIIVDIETAASAIKSAISQAEEKAGISIKLVNVGLPANLLQIEPTQGMIPVTSETIGPNPVKCSILTYRTISPIPLKIASTPHRITIQVSTPTG